MEINFTADTSKDDVFESVARYLQNNGLTVVNSDQGRPWGGFFVIDEKQSQRFIDLFFRDVEEGEKRSTGKISPKILIVEREKRLSWQYHHRRAELWKVIGGRVGIIKSDSDTETSLQVKKVGDVITLRQGERHRLVGLEEWGVVAEIWKHTDPENPSDENDIVRVQDDFGR